MSLKNLVTKIFDRKTRLGESGNDPVLVFTHIPKTAGGSLTQIFRENLLADQVLDLSQLKVRERTDAVRALKEEISPVAETVKVVHGHVNFCFGVHKYFRREVVNLTILRNPVDRFVSLYYFVRQLKNGNKIAEEILTKGLTLDDFAKYETFQPLDNVMVRYLANSRGRNENLTALDRHLLAEAKENLLKHFDLFGITEEFDDIAEQVCHRFNLKKGNDIRLNASGRPALEEISAETLNTIRERNSYDQELWEFARDQIRSR